MRSRKLADDAIRAMSGPDFNVCSLNAPFVLGHLEGLGVAHLDVLVQYAQGKLEGVPVFAPAGGTSHITVTSLSEAAIAALDHGESGRAYLVGDENLSWKQYLEMWFEAVGVPTDLEVRSDEHPLAEYHPVRRNTHRSRNALCGDTARNGPTNSNAEFAPEDAVEATDRYLGAPAPTPAPTARLAAPMQRMNSTSSCCGANSAASTSPTAATAELSPRPAVGTNWRLILNRNTGSSQLDKAGYRRA